MKRLSILAMFLFACGGGSEPPSVFNTWIYSDSIGGGYGLTIVESTHTYVYQEFATTSATSLDDEVETGTVVVTPTTITFTPQESTCPGAAPPYTLSYVIAPDGSLTMDYGGGVISLHVDTVPPSSNGDVVFGCFDNSTGAFTPGPLAPVM
jgi:hypothetical protein